MSLTIRKAVPEDAKFMAEIAAENHISLNSGPEAGNTGFLMVALSEEGYAEQIRCYSHIFVAEKEGRIVGYLIAAVIREIEDFYSEDEKPKQTKALLKRTVSEDVYISQVAVSKHVKRQGVLSAIYEGFLEKSKFSGDLVLYIVQTPIRNNASIGFFSKRGFVLNGEDDGDGWVSGFYKKSN